MLRLLTDRIEVDVSGHNMTPSCIDNLKKIRDDVSGLIEANRFDLSFSSYVSLNPYNKDCSYPDTNYYREKLVEQIFEAEDPAGNFRHDFFEYWSDHPAVGLDDSYLRAFKKIIRNISENLDEVCDFLHFRRRRLNLKRMVDAVLIDWLQVLLWMSQKDRGFGNLVQALRFRHDDLDIDYFESVEQFDILPDFKPIDTFCRNDQVKYGFAKWKDLHEVKSREFPPGISISLDKPLFYSTKLALGMLIDIATAGVSPTTQMLAAVTEKQMSNVLKDECMRVFLVVDLHHQQEHEARISPVALSLSRIQELLGGKKTRGNSQATVTRAMQEIFQGKTVKIEKVNGDLKRKVKDGESVYCEKKSGMSMYKYLCETNKIVAELKSLRLKGVLGDLSDDLRNEIKTRQLKDINSLGDRAIVDDD